MQYQPVNGSFVKNEIFPVVFVFTPICKSFRTAAVHEVYEVAATVVKRSGVKPTLR
jgi:hypothetical protein